MRLYVTVLALLVLSIVLCSDAKSTSRSKHSSPSKSTHHMHGGSDHQGSEKKKHSDKQSEQTSLESQHRPRKDHNIGEDKHAKISNSPHHIKHRRGDDEKEGNEKHTAKKPRRHGRKHKTTILPTKATSTTPTTTVETTTKKKKGGVGQIITAPIFKCAEGYKLLPNRGCVRVFY